MAEQFIEGFDKYGPIGMGAGQTSLTALLTASEWNSTHASGATAPITIVAGLSTPGLALQLVGKNTNSECSISKTLSSNLGRILGGMRFSLLIGASVPDYCITFGDSGTGQCAIVINGVSGTFSFYSGQYWTPSSGSVTGTLIQSTAKNVASLQTHYLEWDITIGSNGAFELWLDGIPMMLGAGNTKGGTANSTVNTFQVVATQINGIGSTLNQFNVDDIYIFDTTGSFCNAVVQTSPRVETGVGTSDSSIQFTNGATIVGPAYSVVTATAAPGVALFLQRVTPTVSMTLNSVSCLPMATNGSVKFKCVLYSDSAGAPNTLTATGNETIGTTSGIVFTGAFASGQSLTGGTSYWIGFITDTSLALAEVDGTTTGTTSQQAQTKANTYGSGAPAGPLSGMTTGLANWLMYGNCTGSGSNYVSENVAPPVGDSSFVTDSTVGHEDLYGFPALSVAPSTIYTCAVKVYAKKADAGTRTVSLDMKSSSTDGNGSSAGQAPGTSYGWIGSFFNTDPNTSAAWTAANLNAAKSGFKIAS